MNSTVTQKMQVYTVILCNTESLCSGPWIKLFIQNAVIKGVCPQWLAYFGPFSI